jgi:hypothetical protein
MKMAQYAYEEGHKVGWDEVRLLEIESNNRYRKANPVWTFFPSFGTPLPDQYVTILYECL